MAEDGRTRRRTDTRQRLYEAAMELIAEHGFSATTVEDEGHFDAALDVRMAAAALFGVCLVVAVDWLVFEPDRSPAEVQSALITVIRARVGV